MVRWCLCWKKSPTFIERSYPVTTRRFGICTSADFVLLRSLNTCESVTHQAAACGLGRPSWVTKPRCCGKLAWSTPWATMPLRIALYSAGRQSLWPKRPGRGTPPVPAGQQGRLVWMGASAAMSRDHSRRGPIRLRRVMAGRIPPGHLLAGYPSQRAPVSAVV